MKSKIDKSLADSLCKLCKKADENIDHHVSACSKLQGMGGLKINDSGD